MREGRRLAKASPEEIDETFGDILDEVIRRQDEEAACRKKLEEKPKKSDLQ